MKRKYRIKKHEYSNGNIHYVAQKRSVFGIWYNFNSDNWGSGYFNTIEEAEKSIEEDKVSVKTTTINMEDYKKKYEEALLSIKRLYDNADNHEKELIEQEFPDFKVNQDEKIREALLSHFQHLKDCSGDILYLDGFTLSDLISWLEKKDYSLNEKDCGVLFDIEHYLINDINLTPERKVECIEWLKTHYHPDKTRWTPEKEQIQALESVCNSIGDDDRNCTKSWLESLYLDLKNKF